MSNEELTAVFLILLLLTGLAHLVGYLFVKLRQPKVVGEILAGVVLGPALLGRLPFIHNALHQDILDVLDFAYWLGLLLLMFISGAEMKQLFGRGERRTVSWLIIVGTGIPFVLGLTLGPSLIRPSLAGPNGNPVSLSIILAASIAVTSVPVVSKIFTDHEILHTRFARLVIGVAVLEDIVLWCALAVATAAAGTASLHPWQLSWHLLLTVAFFALGLTIVPRAVKRINEARWNIFAQQSPIGYCIGLMLAYCVIAGTLEVNLVFAAFLAGFAVAQEKQEIFADAMESIGKVSLAFLIPVYFAMVGLKLDLIHGISLWLIVIFLAGSSAIKMLSVSVAGRFAGFRGLDLINLGMTTNARGGPGIVLASIAFDAGIISATFYTTLVIVAVLTSQFAGAWLDYIRRKGWPLLKGDAATEEVEDVSSEGRADGLMRPTNADAGQTAGMDPGTEAQ
jgi:Kef-type K+ transport system membrane component KefB